MRNGSWCLAAFALGASLAVAQQPVQPPAPQPAGARDSARKVDDAMLKWLQKYRRMERANELRPRRRDEPLRFENITDMEVREIQEVAAKLAPKAIVNISPVVTGCPCEEGPECTDQVYIVANTSENSVGLQLSRVRNLWQVGVMQRWWIRYDALLARRADMDWRAYEASEAELLRDLPECVGELVPATASNPAEGTK